MRMEIRHLDLRPQSKQSPIEYVNYFQLFYRLNILQKDGLIGFKSSNSEHAQGTLFEVELVLYQGSVSNLWTPSGITSLSSIKCAMPRATESGATAWCQLKVERQLLSH